jgi:hypothetical protein
MYRAVAAIFRFFATSTHQVVLLPPFGATSGVSARGSLHTPAVFHANPLYNMASISRPAV